MPNVRTDATSVQPLQEPTAELLSEVGIAPEAQQDSAPEERMQRIIAGRLLTAMSSEEVFAKATSVYYSYLEVLKTASVEALQAYAQNLSERVPILKQADYLLATVQATLSDAQFVERRHKLGSTGHVRSHDVIVDVTALDVMDSFAVRTLRDFVHERLGVPGPEDRKENFGTSLP